MRKSVIFSLFAALVFTACGSTHTHEQHDQHEGHDHAHEAETHTAAEHEDHEAGNHEAPVATAKGAESSHSGEIIFTPAQAARIDFAVDTVEAGPFYGVIPATGQILAAQGDESTLVAPVSGTISFAAKRLTEGSAVSKGEALCYVSSKQLAEGDYVARTQSTYDQAKAAYERAQGLILDQLITTTEFETRKQAFEQAEAAQKALQGRTSAQGTVVVAPQSGFVQQVLVAQGSFVEVGQPIATITQNRRLVLRAEVSQRYLSTLRTLTGANIKTPYNNHTYALKELGGRLLSVGKSTASRSAYVPVTFEFDNRGDFVQGAFVEVFLLSAPRANTVTVPLSSLIEEQGSYYVFVQVDEEGYMKRQVKTGANDGLRMEILSGLASGERIVTRGAQNIKMASFAGAIPHGHAH